MRMNPAPSKAVASVIIPGKVMLSGEYAVLLGGTAVLAPVPRYMVVTESDHEPETPYSPVMDAALFIPVPELYDFEKADPLLYITIDRCQFAHTDKAGRSHKFGLGSSAAEAVGIVALRFERARLSWKERRKEITVVAIQAHRKAQGGRGSGADVAACAYGQPILFENRKDETRIEVIEYDPEAESFPLAIAWTGVVADTRIMVDRFNQWIAASSSNRNMVLQRLVELSCELGESWFGKDRSGLLDMLEEYTVTMEKCAESAGIEYSLPLHHEIAEWAKSHGGFAKPTGAGGGDMILLAGELPYEQRNLSVIPILQK